MQEIHTHTRAVAGKSFPNVLTQQSIQYKFDDYSIIRLISSHIDHCAIMQGSENKENHQIIKVAGKLLSTRADMVFPKL